MPTTLPIAYKNATSALNSCLQDVQEWMLSSMLKLNPKKQSSPYLDLMLR